MAKPASKKSQTKKVCIRCIVKRQGHVEEYDSKKVYASCYWAARSSHLSEKDAEKIAEKVMKETTKWVDQKPEIDSKEIFLFIGKALQKHNKDVAFMYLTHKDLS